MKNKFIFIKVTFIISLITLITLSTIGYLYYTNNISSADYLKLIVSDTYENNLYNNMVEFISNKLNPLKFIEFNNNEYNSFIINETQNPIISIYNSDASLSYKTEYNNKTTVSLSAYYLSSYLNELGINTVLGKENLKYVIDIGRSDTSNNIKIDGIDYGGIILYTNKDNMNFITKLHIKLNNDCKGISKIYYSNEYDNIKIDIGGYNSNMSSIVKSIKILSNSIKEVINE